MIKIDRIEVSGFKNIEQTELELGNFNIIIGPNNSGKLNFIQIFSFLNFIINGSLAEVENSFKTGFVSTHFGEILPFKHYRSIKNRNVKTETKQDIKFGISFSNIDTNRVFNYQLILDASHILFDRNYRIKSERLDVKEATKPGKASNIFSRTSKSVKYGSDFSKMDNVETISNYSSVIRVLKILKELREDYRDAIDSLDLLLMAPTFCFSYIELFKAEQERVNDFHGKIVSYGLEKQIIEIEETEKWDIFNTVLRDILNIENATVFSFDSTIESGKAPTKFLYFTHHGIVKNLFQLSDGTILIIALITKILTSTNRFILIEEPENSIHPKVLIDLIAFLRSYSENIQFLITSHSIPIINKANVNEIIVSCINDDGTCNLYNISSKRDLVNKLKKPTTNFSDELFFATNDLEEFV